MKTAFALALLALAVSAPSAAARSKSCTAPAYPAAGSFTSLKVTKATCAKAKKVALAFHKCRTKTGPTGRCVKKHRRRLRLPRGAHEHAGRHLRARDLQEEEAQGHLRLPEDP